MAFLSNKQLEGRIIGSRLKLIKPVKVLKGEFTRGSILEVIGESDQRGEFLCRDLESGEEVYLHPLLNSYQWL